MAIVKVVLGFNNLGRSVTPIFLFRNGFYLQFYLQSSNCNILGLAATVAFFANEARFTQV